MSSTKATPIVPVKSIDHDGPWQKRSRISDTKPSKVDRSNGTANSDSGTNSNSGNSRSGRDTPQLTSTQETKCAQQAEHQTLALRMSRVEEKIECLLRTRTPRQFPYASPPMQTPPSTPSKLDHSKMLLSTSNLLVKLYESISYIEARYKYVLPYPPEYSSPSDDNTDEL